MQRLLAGRSMPTAILASNDLTAIGALRGLYRSGIHVPGDVSLVSTADILFAPLTHPLLTTVQIANQLLGRLACQTLLGRLGEGKPASEAANGVARLAPSLRVICG